MTQQAATDGFIIFGTIALTVWYWYTQYQVLKKNGEIDITKPLIILSAELMLADANVFEATVAARVGVEAGAFWANRFAMHILAGGLSAVVGMQLLTQVMQAVRATYSLIKNSKSVYNWLQLFKQWLDVVFTVLITLAGPIFNWLSIAYAEGDLYIHTEQLVENIFSISGWLSGDVFAAFEFTGELHKNTFNAGGAVLLHLFTVFALTSFFLDLAEFKKPDFNPKEKKVQWSDMVKWLTKYFGIAESELQHKINIEPTQSFMIQNNIIFYTKLCFDSKRIMSQGIDPESDEYKAAKKDYDKGINHLKNILT